MSSSRETPPAPTAIALAMYGFLAIRGERAVEFLQGQLSCDLREAGTDRVIEGCCCTPKGRVLASFLLWQQSPASILLRLRQEILTETMAWLGKFAVFSRVAIAPPEPGLCCIGLLGAEPGRQLSGLFATWPEPGAIVEVAPDCHLVARPGSGELVELWVPAASGEPWLERLGASLRTASDAAWRHALVRSGAAEIQAPTRDEFLPQMLDFDRRGLVSFRKGCYTGQEVVARTRYKGSVKRHLARLEGRGMTAPAIGAELRLGEEKVGRVVECARLDDGELAILAVLSDDALARATTESLLVDGIPLRPGPPTL